MDESKKDRRGGLVLERKSGEKFLIHVDGREIAEITLIETKGCRARLYIRADKERVLITRPDYRGNK